MGLNAQEITDTLLVNAYATGEDQYKMYLTETDRETLLDLVQHSPRREGRRSRLVENVFCAASRQEGTVA